MHSQLDRRCGPNQVVVVAAAVIALSPCNPRNTQDTLLPHTSPSIESRHKKGGAIETVERDYFFIQRQCCLLMKGEKERDSL